MAEIGIIALVTLGTLATWGLFIAGLRSTRDSSPTQGDFLIRTAKTAIALGASVMAVSLCVALLILDKTRAPGDSTRFFVIFMGFAVVPASLVTISYAVVASRRYRRALELGATETSTGPSRVETD